jgi:hypothetical protein
VYGIEFWKRQLWLLASLFLATRTVINSFPSVVIPAGRRRYDIIRRPWPTGIDAGVVRSSSCYATPLGTARFVTEVPLGLLYSRAALR